VSQSRLVSARRVTTAVCLLAWAGASVLVRADQRAAYERARTQFPLAQSPSLALAALQWRMGEQESAASGVALLARTNPIDTQSDPWWRYDISHVGDVQALFVRLDAAVIEAMK